MGLAVRVPSLALLRRAPPRAAVLRPWVGWLVAAAVAAVGYACFYFGRGLDVPDEGLLLHAADRLARGEVPYRDVYFIYTPGLQYLLALLFRLFGSTLGVAHALELALHVALVVVVYALSLRLGGWRPAAALAALVAVAAGLSSYRFLLGLVTVWALTRYAEGGCRGWLFVSGLLVGTTYLFAQEVGLYTLGAALGCLGLAYLAGPRTRRSLGDAVSRAGLVLLGAALVLAPWLAVMAVQGALAAMLDATLHVAFLHQPRYMHVPLPPLLPLVPTDLSTNVVWGPPRYLFYVKIMLYLPLLLAATAGLVLGWSLRRGRLWSDDRRALPLALFAALALATLADRADYVHLRQVLPAALVLLAWLLARLRSLLLARGWSPAAACLALLPLVPMLLVSLGEAEAHRREQSTPLETVRGRVLVDETMARDLGALLAAVRQRTPPGEAIYVAPAETAVYYLADRPNPTRFGQLVSTELELLRENDGAVQRELVARVAAAGVRWVVLAPTENVNGYPFDAYAPLIMRHIEAHYVPDQAFGYWTLWRAR